MTRTRGYRRFAGDVRALGAERVDYADFQPLAEAYGKADRHYHTLTHVAACLAALDASSKVVDDQADVAVPRWLQRRSAPSPVNPLAALGV